MTKSFYVVSEEFRKYSSKLVYTVFPFSHPVFGSSSFDEIKDLVMKHNLEVEKYLDSDNIVFPLTLPYYNFCEITNLDV